MIDLLRQEVALASTWVVKLGTRVLTDSQGRLDRHRIDQLARQVHRLHQHGRRVVLVSSGAVAAGMARLGLQHRPLDIPQLQAIAAVGQAHLVEAYEEAFGRFGIHVAQVLLTAEDVQHRTRYLNVRNTLLALLRHGVVPVVNENDTVSVEELQTTFGDNDRLAALVTTLLQGPLLVLLSDVEGLYDGPPEEPGSKVIPTVTCLDESIFALAQDRKGSLSKGGMASKLAAAHLAGSVGENCIIASGRDPQVLLKILRGEPVGTLILPQANQVPAWKRWIGFTARPRGKLLLDPGAVAAVVRQGCSLLAAGVTEVQGNFAKGDVVRLCNAQGEELARGLVNYPADQLRRIRGLKSHQIAAALGHCPYEEVIHRDNLVLTTSAASAARK